MIDTCSRLKELIDEYCESNNSLFAREIGVTEGTVRKFLLGGGIKSDIIMTLAEKYAISPTWLLLGEGGKYLDDSPSSLSPAHIGEGLPLLPIDAWAGQYTGGTDPILPENCQWFTIPAFSSANFLVTVRGDSMIPQYLCGDIIACRNVSLTNIWFQWGKTYLINTDQGTLLKKIIQGPNEETITLISTNPNYAPIDLCKTDIISIAIVQGLIRVE